MQFDEERLDGTNGPAIMAQRVDARRQVNDPEGHASLVMMHDPAGASAEALRGLYYSLRRALGGAPLGVLAVCSAARGEGRSTIAANLALTAAAYREGPAAGEQVALRLRELLFEEGTDVADPEVLREVARAHGVGGPIDDVAPVLADHAEGVRRGVVGSPHFFAGDGSYFCPSLDVGRDEHGELRVAVDGPAFERFVAACFG